jgi:hypothetical protein
VKLIVAQFAGFCFGVKRAIDLALDAAKKYPKDLLLDHHRSGKQSSLPERPKGLINL